MCKPLLTFSKTYFPFPSTTSILAKDPLIFKVSVISPSVVTLKTIVLFWDFKSIVYVTSRLFISTEETFEFALKKSFPKNVALILWEVALKFEITKDALPLFVILILYITPSTYNWIESFIDWLTSTVTITSESVKKSESNVNIIEVFNLATLNEAVWTTPA